MGNMAGNAKQARSRRGGKKPRPAIESAEKRYAKRVRKVRST